MKDGGEQAAAVLPHRTVVELEPWFNQNQAAQISTVSWWSWFAPAIP
jgi:hypothetical protein